LKGKNPRIILYHNASMEILPVSTRILRKGDDLAGLLANAASWEDGDIVAVSSKAVATVEGAVINLKTLKITDEAKELARISGRSPAFRQAILEETHRLNGTVTGPCPQAVLTEVRPDGLKGTFLVPNAGLDQSNIPEGSAIGWPHDPVASVRALRSALKAKTKKNIALLLTDSCCRPRRWGVTAFALVVSGFDPLVSKIGTRDLFGRELMMTVEAVADQLATAANMIMGNAAESRPAAIIRDHGIPFTDFEGWVPGISKEDDLFCM